MMMITSWVSVFKLTTKDKALNGDFGTVMGGWPLNTCISNCSPCTFHMRLFATMITMSRGIGQSCRKRVTPTSKHSKFTKYLIIKIATHIRAKIG